MIDERIKGIEEGKLKVREVLNDLSYEIIENEFKIKKERVKILGVKTFDDRMKEWIISWLDLDKRKVNSFHISVVYE